MTGLDAYQAALTAAAVRGIQGSLSAVTSAHPGESLWAYALVTDDDLDGVGCLACTEEFLTTTAPAYLKLLGQGEDLEHATELLRFMPVDWTYDDGVHSLDPASSMLSAHARSASGDDAIFTSHVDASVTALVEALAVLRGNGTVASNVFLSVLSSDPSDHLLDLEEGGVRRLNTPDLFRRWHATMTEG